MKTGKTEKTEKTNVMRLLDAAGIPYRSMEYPVDENDLSGVHVAAVLGQDVDTVFKTLVLKGEKTGYPVTASRSFMGIISTFLSPAALAAFFKSSSSATGIQQTRYPVFSPLKPKF